jgi:hypothetical protein
MSITSSEHRYVDNINLDLKEILRESVDWINLDQDKNKRRIHFSAVISFQVPQNEKSVLTGRGIV